MTNEKPPGVLDWFLNLFKPHNFFSGVMSTHTLDLEAKDYFKQLLSNKEKVANMNIVLDEMKKNGITAVESQAGILAVISKESDFIPHRENLNYTSDQLVTVFSLPKIQADKLAHKPQEIAEVVYMPPHNYSLGNNAPGDGWKYRGFSYNQITGKISAHKYATEAGIDIDKKPELLEDPDACAKMTISFFKDGFKILMSRSITLSDDKTLVPNIQYYHNDAGSINGFTDELDAAAAFYHVNAGIGQKEKFLLADVTKGRHRTLERAPGFKDYILTKNIIV